MRVDWSMAPDWANWCARDNSGDAWWFDEEPELMNEMWFGSGEEAERADGAVSPPDSEPFSQTLQRRPIPGRSQADGRREKIATAVLSGLAADRHHSDTQANPMGMAAIAVEYADALIAELDKPA